MGWLKLDASAMENRKWFKIPRERRPLAQTLWTMGLCYASRYLTDGWLPDELYFAAINFDREEAARLAELLVEAGLWHRVEDGYEIHDFAGVR